jgi:hypothetical protein
VSTLWTDTIWPEAPFIFELKDNREVSDSEVKRDLGQFERLDQMKLPEEKPVKVRIKDLKFPVKVFRQVFRNKDGTEGERFPVTNDSGLSADRFKTFYKKRWGVEKYQKSLNLRQGTIILR